MGLAEVMMEQLDYERAITALIEVLPRVSYKDWDFRLRDRALLVTLRLRDSVTGTPTVLTHTLPIPPQEFIHPKGALRWLLERVFDIERHEAMEHFLVDGAAPFFPQHEPGENPYVVVERDEPVKVAPYRAATMGDMRWRPGYASGR